jgi:pyruvate,orthophosphate dikinase
MLQTRTGKRTAAAAVKIAVDMVGEGLITKQDAIMRVEPNQVNQLLLPRLDPDDKEKAVKAGRLLASGLNASPGAGVGIAVFEADRAVEAAKSGPVILVRYETSPDDVHGMYASKGILTQHGGATSHAAVVARGAGLPCVAGCESLHVSEAAAAFTVKVDGQEITVKEGDHISIDGSTGEVFAGQIKKVDPDFDNETDLKVLLGWADEIKRLGVWANGDYPRDAVNAIKYGAKGIGLCRTEHMFFETERLPIVQRMILAKTVEERKKALDELLPIQRGDFLGILKAMSPYPVIIRLIDPPLHEFLPNPEELLLEVTGLRMAASASKGDAAIEKILAEKETLLKAVQNMREANPMMGLRGCRLGITMPEITEMQVRAILEAACMLQKDGVVVHPEVMIPLVGHVNELKNQLDALTKVAKDVLKEQGVKLAFKFGTMIEVPRGALTADEIAEYAEFFSFGTNDLTQMTFGFSRDDAEGAFLLKYVENKILPVNPFQTIDRNGVGELMKIAVTKGRSVRKNLEVGICGEHGGDPESIALCHELGLNYVSCSPFRVPVARLAAAQAALTKTEKDK